MELGLIAEFDRKHLAGRESDPSLVGRVKSKQALDEMGAEQLANSVIYQDTAYNVIDGFIGEPLPP